MPDIPTAAGRRVQPAATKRSAAREVPVGRAARPSAATTEPRRRRTTEEAGGRFEAGPGAAAARQSDEGADGARVGRHARWGRRAAASSGS